MSWLLVIASGHSFWVTAAGHSCWSQPLLNKADYETLPARAMSGSVVAQVLSLIVSGSSSNWWGLGCPSHCSASFGTYFIVWGSGFSVGALAAVFYLRVLIISSPASASSPVPPRDSPAPRGHLPASSSRLAAYRA